MTKVPSKSRGHLTVVRAARLYSSVALSALKNGDYEGASKIAPKLLVGEKEATCWILEV